MGTSLWKAIGLLALVLVLVAVGARGQAAGTVTTLSESDAGRHVQLKRGDTLIIELQGNPTTGFSWDVASVDAAVLKLEGDPGFEADTPGLPGSGGTCTFTFKALGSGETKLLMTYQRPWEKDTPAADDFEVTVVVD